MKFGICTINYKRPQVFELWVASIKRLRAFAGFFPVVCVSELEDQDICLRNDIHFIHRQNKPVTRKWNRGFQWLRMQEVDYAMICGSDDLISNELLADLIRGMEQDYDLIGIKDIFFYGTSGQYKNKLFYKQCKSMLGVCKTIHRRVLDKLEWNPYTQDRNFGMDGMVSRAIAPYVTSTYYAQGSCTDIKTKDGNLNRINMWADKIKQPCDRLMLWNYLSEEEKKILNAILANEK